MRDLGGADLEFQFQINPEPAAPPEARTRVTREAEGGLIRITATNDGGNRAENVFLTLDLSPLPDAVRSSA